MANTIFESGSTGFYFITADMKQGYHKIAVRDSNVEKLAFFGLNNENTVLLLCYMALSAIHPFTLL